MTAQSRQITVCWKWVSVDGGAPDERWSGVSHADEAALEVALQLAEARGLVDVTVITVGPPAADSVLRDALAAGATRAVRVDAADAPSRDVAAAIAAVSASSDTVLCGDYSLDRGTGSVPAYLAAELGAAQALGLVSIERLAEPLRVVRRLDGGRREILEVSAPAVLSVEGSVARLRRASLAASLASKSALIEVVPGASTAGPTPTVSSYRPRARTMPAPSGGTLERVRDILDIGGADAAHSERVTLEPADAATHIINQLRDWGYLAGD